jgi:hypothetical protein
LTANRPVGSAVLHSLGPTARTRSVSSARFNDRSPGSSAVRSLGAGVGQVHGKDGNQLMSGPFEPGHQPSQGADVGLDVLDLLVPKPRQPEPVPRGHEDLVAHLLQHVRNAPSQRLSPVLEQGLVRPHAGAPPPGQQQPGQVAPRRTGGDHGDGALQSRSVIASKPPRAGPVSGR